MPRTLKSLTGLRAIAAAAVFLRHTQYLFSSNSGNWITLRLFVQGGVGVSFFFILSGFVLTWSWKPGLWNFYRRRFARIYPTYLASMVLAFALQLVTGGSVTTKAVIAVALLSQSWFSGYNTFIAINGVAWSLSCEAFFYVVFPLALIFAVRARPAWRRGLLFFLILGIFAVPTWLAPAQGTVIRQLWISYIFPPTRLLEFLCGVLLALEIREGKWPSVPLPLAWTLTAAGYLLAGEAGIWPDGGLTTYQGYAAVTVVPFLVLIGAYARRDIEGRTSLMASSMVVRLGEISYAFYLIHFLVIQLFAHYTSTWRPTVFEAGSALVALLIVAVTAASALYYTIERPTERRLRPAAPRPEAVIASV